MIPSTSLQTSLRPTSQAASFAAPIAKNPFVYSSTLQSAKDVPHLLQTPDHKSSNLLERLVLPASKGDAVAVKNVLDTFTGLSGYCKAIYDATKIAIAQGHSEVAQMLLTHKESKGMLRIKDMLKLAVIEWNTPVAEAILSLAQIDDRSVCKALLKAIKNNAIEIAKLILLKRSSRLDLNTLHEARYQAEKQFDADVAKTLFIPIQWDDLRDQKYIPSKYETIIWAIQPYATRSYLAERNKAILQAFIALGKGLQNNFTIEYESKYDKELEKDIQYGRERAFDFITRFATRKWTNFIAFFANELEKIVSNPKIEDPKAETAALIFRLHESTRKNVLHRFFDLPVTTINEIYNDEHKIEQALVDAPQPLSFWKTHYAKNTAPFQGRSVDELANILQNCIKEHLAECRKKGEMPDKDLLVLYSDDSDCIL